MTEFLPELTDAEIAHASKRNATSTRREAMIPTIGRIVHYRIGGTDESPELRPATIVRVWDPVTGYANLVVTVDGLNDLRRTDVAPDFESDPVGHRTWWAHAHPDEAKTCTAWRTSVTMGSDVGQWRWPAKA